MNPYVAPVPNLLCRSLKQREPWAEVAAQLLQSAGWREEHLEKYDLALSIPQQQQPGSRVFRILLLAAADVGLPETTQRVAVFSSLGGWRNAALVFLADENDSLEATRALAELQVEIMESLPGLRIIPITSPEALPMIIGTLVGSLASSALSHPRPLDLVQDLLPYCTVSKPLARRTVKTLAGTGMSLRELVCEIATKEGRLGIGTVAEEEAARFISFWTDEFPLD